MFVNWLFVIFLTFIEIFCLHKIVRNLEILYILFLAIFCHDKDQIRCLPSKLHPTPKHLFVLEFLSSDFQYSLIFMTGHNSLFTLHLVKVDWNINLERFLQRINKMQYIEPPPALKGKKILPSVTTWMSLKALW